MARPKGGELTMTPGTALLAVATIATVASLGSTDRAIRCGGIAIGNWLGVAANLLDSSPYAAAINAVLAAIYTYLWWQNRRKGRGKKVAKALGAKSRARVQALVRQMTPSPIPSPVGGRA